MVQSRWIQLTLFVIFCAAKTETGLSLTSVDRYIVKDKRLDNVVLSDYLTIW